MSLDQHESSIFSEKEFETSIKGKAYPTVGQLFVLIPVGLGACILAMIPFMFYFAKNNPTDPRNTGGMLAVGMGMMLGVIILMAIFMVWQKKRHEPDYQFTYKKPVKADFLGKTTITLLATNIATYLLAEKMHLDSLGFSMQMYYNQLSEMGPGMVILAYALIIPVLSAFIVYDIVYDGLLKNYKAYNVLIAVVLLSVLNFKPGLILVALPTSVLSFLIYSRTRAVLYVTLATVLIPLLMVGIMLVMPLSDFLMTIEVLPLWAGLLALVIAGLCWFVLLKDLQKMEPATTDAI
ncbi:hypothetical protein [Chitinophaga sp. sic0106]|uniref:hypothetical protein n=1 Tax=Chitinophaga sp. sic0106 TaxID=2854785 RepID=UPI001C46E992|nr:hypothetical protein [Chitinophaga sp. sic0106]MBV7533486.1 hypothetical protein [Chitinophaga sp. sic0106]